MINMDLKFNIFNNLRIINIPSVDLLQQEKTLIFIA